MKSNKTQEFSEPQYPGKVTNDQRACDSWQTLNVLTCCRVFNIKTIYVTKFILICSDNIGKYLITSLDDIVCTRLNNHSKEYLKELSEQKYSN